MKRISGCSNDCCEAYLDTKSFRQNRIGREGRGEYALPAALRVEQRLAAAVHREVLGFGFTRMTDHRPGVVEIFRDFLAVHTRMAELVSHYENRTLSFELVEDLVGDDNSSALYRR